MLNFEFEFGWNNMCANNFFASGPKFTGLFLLNAGGIAVLSFCLSCLSDFGYLHPFVRYSRLKSEVVRNSAKFCTFLAPFFVPGPHRF